MVRRRMGRFVEAESAIAIMIENAPVARVGRRRWS